ncbi:MAG TPA: CPBP family glutamic-type intramembrane protease [Dissulfurispiraceae bacterium]|nr:CPBP family glutamic-type intramembrane protease [Dissulfurispiraceae bacterium]
MNRLAKTKDFFRRLNAKLTEHEIENPIFVTVFKIIWHSIKRYFVEKPGQIIGTTFILLMFWGTHGNLELLGCFWHNWRIPGTNPACRPLLLPGLPWGNELISFWGGAFLLVILPIILIKFIFKQPLSLYGLGMPPKHLTRLASTTLLVLFVCSCMFFFLFGSRSADMRQLYPLFKNFKSVGQFILYELSYLPFFIAIEFIFRGYLLFGLAQLREEEVRRASGVHGVFYFHRYALLIQMLSYTAWHLGKPLSELWGTLGWGLAAGAMALALRSIWPVVVSHWLLNVVVDGYFAIKCHLISI